MFVVSVLGDVGYTEAYAHDSQERFPQREQQSLPGSQEDQNSTKKHVPHAMWGVGCGYSYIRDIIPSSVHS